MAVRWQDAVGFSDRLSVIVAITGAYKEAHREASAADASKHGRAEESRIFAESSTLAEYQLRCQHAVKDVPAAETQPTTIETFAARLVEKGGTAEKFGRYRTAHHFNNGLFSRIFVAKAPDDDPVSGFTGRPGAYVALKATQLSSMAAPHNSEREVRVLRRAAGPSIVALWESFYDGAGHLVLVFPFLPWTLEHFVRAKRPFDRALKRCLRDVFKALEHLHSLGVIHRDVKPANILMESPDGPAYLSDFGVAWCPGDPASEPQAGKITDVGTTCYRAPEVLFGYSAYDTGFDLWAAGCVVAEVAAADGKPLFEPGDVGTDLTLILSLFENLGTPSPEIWPEITLMPDWGKMNYHQHQAKDWKEIVPGIPAEARDLVAKLVCYSSSRRLSAHSALEHPFFADHGSDP